MSPLPAHHDSDSEDDPDYVPLDEEGTFYWCFCSTPALSCSIVESSDDNHEPAEENAATQKTEVTEAEKAAQQKQDTHIRR